MLFTFSKKFTSEGKTVFLTSNSGQKKKKFSPRLQNDELEFVEYPEN